MTDELNIPIPPLAQDDYKRLKASIAHDGQKIPVLIDANTGKTVDGEHRLRACQELGIKPIIEKRELTAKEAARLRVTLNLARRQLSPEQKRELVLALRKPSSPFRQSDVAEMVGITQERVSQIENISNINSYNAYIPDQRRTVSRAQQDEIAERVQSGETQAQIAADYGISQPRVSQITQMVEVREKQPSPPHVSYNAGENEWYTPKEIIKAARSVMGSIDLDPASTTEANTVVKAKEFYSIEDNGLVQHWRGKVWMNPPYSQPLIGQFIHKLVLHVQNNDVLEAITLVNNATETQWFRELISVASAICFPQGRVKFWSPARIAAPLQGQAIIYAGADVKKFAKEFRKFGWIAKIIF